MTSLQPCDRRQLSTTSYSLSSRNIQFFETTGGVLVHPLSYTLKPFQKEIIRTALLKNTLISLPPGLGKLFIAAVLTCNFHRWFLNSKIVILSQTRSYLTDLLNAFHDYTSLSKDVYSELPNGTQAKDSDSACKKPILLTSPQKFVELMSENMFKIPNVVLLIVFESSKITKCQEYNQILEAMAEYEYRTILFIDSTGFNPKTIRQVVEQFSISKFQVKNCDSEDVKECTYRSKIDHHEVDISKLISDIKDTFFAVLEKYSRKLKDSKIVSGNVTTLSRLQIHKIKDKLKKNPTINMPQVQKDELINSLTICAFLSQGIELLHNWGIRAFYDYLFDEEKDADIKTLITKDEDLKEQMIDLNDYLKTSSKKIDTSPASIVHPKLIHLKDVVTEHFKKFTTYANEMRIVIVCSMPSVVNEIDRLFRNLPDAIRYHCIQTKAKCLANEPEHKEIVKHFMDGVISVLVISNLVDEVLEVEATKIISLDPCKTLLKTSDPRFFKGTPECLFILTRGNELIKFEELYKEIKNEQKGLDVTGIGVFLQDSPRLFLDDFDPIFECTNFTEPKRNFKNSPGQRTIHHYLESNHKRSSLSLFENTDTSLFKSYTPNQNRKFSDFDDSPALFGDTSEESNVGQKFNLASFDAVNDADLVPMLPDNNEHLRKKVQVESNDDGNDDLILDFTETNCLKTVTSPTKPMTLDTARTAKKFLWTSKSSFSLRKDKPNENVTKPKEVITLNDDNNKKVRSVSPELGKARNADKPQSMNQFVTVAEVHWSPFENNDKIKEEMSKLQNETFVDFLFSDSSSEDKAFNQIVDQNEQVRPPTIDYDKIEVDTTYDANCEVGGASRESNNTCNIDEFDSDCDFIPNSPSAKRPCKVFSSRSVESQSLTNSQPSRSVSPSPRPKRRLYNDMDSLDDIPSHFLTDIETAASNLNSSRNAKTKTSILNSSNQKSSNITTPVNRDSTPSLQYRAPSCSTSFAQNVSSSCFGSTSPGPSARSVSPVLFSTRSSKSDRSRFSSTYNQSSSIKFETTFDTSKYQLQRADNNTANKSKSKTSLIDSLLDEEDEMIFSNVSEIEQAALRKCNVSSKDSGYANTSKYSSSTPKIMRTPEQPTSKSNDSTPDSIVLDGYSTPVEGNNAKKSSVPPDVILRESPTAMIDLDEIPQSSKRYGYSSFEVNRAHKVRSLSNAKQTKLTSFCKNKSIGFSDSSLSLGNYSTPNGFELKTKSPIFNSDTATSADQTKGLSASRLSTMDRLNKVENCKEDTPIVKKNARFGFLQKTNHSLFRETIKRRTEMRKANISDSSPVRPTHHIAIVDSDEEFPWLDTSPINPPKFKKPEPLPKTPLVSRHSTPVSARSSDHEIESSTSTPEARVNRSPVFKRRSKTKRNLAEQFIDREAEVSGDDDEDAGDDEWSNTSNLDDNIDSFIDDDATKPSDITNYLRSLNSPRNPTGRFRIPELSESRLKANVYSQVPDENQSYENDSFCVDQVSDSEANEYPQGVLTQMEWKIEQKQRMSKNQVKSKRPFQRIIEDSSPDSPQMYNTVKIKRRSSNSNKKKRILSSDSDIE